MVYHPWLNGSTLCDSVSRFLAGNREAELKPAVKRKEDAWKEVLGARDEDATERYLEVYKEEKRKVKRCIYQSEKEVQEQFERKMNQWKWGIVLEGGE